MPPTLANKEVGSEAQAQLFKLLLDDEPGCIVAKSSCHDGCGDATCEELAADYDIPEHAPPEWDAILSASVKNDALGIRRLVQEGVPASHSNPVKQSALHLASLWGNGKSS